ncbi:MAG: FtsX-like permease family protein [Planctomycetota bacterium]
MRIRTLVWKELWHRKLGALVILIGIILCIMMVVGIQRVSLGAINEMRLAMLEMGRNVVILPEGVDENEYWSGDFSKATTTLSEEDLQSVAEYAMHVHKPKVLARHFQGSFQRPVTIDGERLVLSGILVKIDKAAPAVITEDAQKPIPDGEAELGYHAARQLGLEEGDTLDGTWTDTDKGETLDTPTFTVRKVRSETGTIEDYRVFINIATARDIFGVEENVVNVVEAVGCVCTPQFLPTIASRMEEWLREERGRPVNVRHFQAIAEARSDARTTAVRDADVISVAVVLFGALLIGGYSVLNAHERRRETGILLAISARPRHIAWAMLQKMLLLGLVGGVVGCWLTDVILRRHGLPFVTRLQGAMRPYMLAMTGWQMYAVGVGLALALAALPGLVGVWLASRTDPAETLREL